MLRKIFETNNVKASLFFEKSNIAPTNNAQPNVEKQFFKIFNQNMFLELHKSITTETNMIIIPHIVYLVKNNLKYDIFFSLLFTSFPFLLRLAIFSSNHQYIIKILYTNN